MAEEARKIIMKNNKNKLKLESSKIKKTRIKDERHNMLCDKTPFITVEEYKTLRTNINFSAMPDGCKIIGITSSSRSEGKSINSTNIALTFAQTGAKVLLMDCDLRLPKQASYFQLSGSPGISNILAKINSLDECIKHVKSRNVELDFLASGDIPPNPTELLDTINMQNLINILSNSYDYIIIDTPPVNIVSDALVLTKFLSGIIIVIRDMQTDKKELIYAIEKLRYAKANVLGIIYNGVKDNKLLQKKYYS